MKKFVASVGILLTGLSLAGCGFHYATLKHDDLLNRHHDYAQEDPDVRGRREESFDPASQWTVRRDGYLFQFQADPREPTWDEKTSLELAIYDVKTSSSMPVVNAQMTCKVVMNSHGPNMRGIIHSYKTHAAHSQIKPGVYAMPILFGVGGTWRVDYVVDLPGWNNVKVSFPLRVRSSGNPIQEWNQMQPKPVKPADWK